VTNDKIAQTTFVIFAGVVRRECSLNCVWV